MTQTVLDYDQLQLTGLPSVKKPAITGEQSLMNMKELSCRRLMNLRRSACLLAASSDLPMPGRSDRVSPPLERWL